MIMRCFVAALLIALSTHAAWAGSRGFTVVFMDIGSPSFYDTKVFLAYREGVLDSKQRRDCWSDRATGGKALDHIIKKAIPDGLTLDMAKSIWSGDKKVAKQAQQIMAKTKAPNRQGIDGLYVIDARDGHITVMALGTKAPLGAKNPTRKLTIPWNEADPEQGAADFDLVLCRASKPLDYHFSP